MNENSRQPRGLRVEVPGVTKGAMGVAAVLTTDDCQKTYETLSARGVEFTEVPTQQPYGIDCALRDPFGTHIRITQLATQPAEIADADIARWRPEAE